MSNQSSEKRYISSDDILVSLNEKSNTANRARDINHKIDSLEGSLSSLQGKLDDINTQVEIGFKHLSNENTDLTSRVSDTYKQLGELDIVYRNLSSMSVSIDEEVKSLSGEIKDIAEQAESEVFKLSENHEHLVDRVNQLAENAKSTTLRLTDSIQKNTEALTQLGEKLVADIEILADTTQQRDDELALGLDDANRSIIESKARILQLQAVDEAIARRTDILEEASDELVHNVALLHASIIRLDTHNAAISDAIAELSATSDEHDGMIRGLAENLAITDLRLHSLARVTKRHVKGLTSAIVLLLLIAAGLFAYQHSVDMETTDVAAQRVEVVDQIMTSLNDQHQYARTEIVELTEKLDSRLANLDDELQTVDDKVSSLDGRLTYAMPSTEFGKDSTLHGPTWLAKQSSENYAIRIASSTDKKSLYELVQRYGHYFSNELAFFPAQTQYGLRYFLVYGNFASQQDAESALWNMPRYIDSQRPVVSSFEEIQQYL